MILQEKIKITLYNSSIIHPVQKYITQLNTDAPTVMLHWHEEAELTLITEGDCIYQIDLAD